MPANGDHKTDLKRRFDDEAREKYLACIGGIAKSTENYYAEDVAYNVHQK